VNVPISIALRAPMRRHEECEEDALVGADLHAAVAAASRFRRAAAARAAIRAR
jgi:hypothetical protein